jgi:hypothetical protein
VGRVLPIPGPVRRRLERVLPMQWNIPSRILGVRNLRSYSLLVLAILEGAQVPVQELSMRSKHLQVMLKLKMTDSESDSYLA